MEEEHAQHLKQVLQCLQEDSFHAKKSKCHFGKKKIVQLRPCCRQGGH